MGEDVEGGEKVLQEVGARRLSRLEGKPPGADRLLAKRTLFAVYFLAENLGFRWWKH